MLSRTRWAVSGLNSELWIGFNKFYDDDDDYDDDGS